MRRSILCSLLIVLLIISLAAMVSCSQNEPADTEEVPSEEMAEVPAEDETPAESEASDSKEPGSKEQVFSAYSQVLQDNQQLIKDYNWQLDENNKFINDLSYGDDGVAPIEHPLNKCVAVFDLNGDDIPELLFMTADNISCGILHIYSYKDDAAYECKYETHDVNDESNDESYGPFRDLQVAGGTKYMIYTGKGKGVFHIAHCISDEAAFLANNELKMSDTGEIEQTGYVYNSFVLSKYEQDTDEYYVDGEKVSHDDGAAAFKRMGDDYDKLIMFSGSIPEMSVNEHIFSDTPEAMTYDEAIDYLD